jgi:3-hydroxyacyl-CoA dehydrogenase
MTIKKVGVIGCGLMGHGIVQVAASAGFDVVALEMSQDALDKGLGRVSKSLEKLASKAVEKGKQTEEQAKASVEAARGRIHGSLDKQDLADCDLVVEAIVEDLGIKKELFAELGGLCKPETILASNTSSFPITEMAEASGRPERAEASGRPERVVGLHFFNPVQLMRLVEVVRTDKTAEDAFAAAKAFGEGVGKTAVSCKDTPGFVVNRHRRGDAARLRLPDGPVDADRLRGPRHHAQDPRGLGRALPERARVRDPGDPSAEGRRGQAGSQDR